MDKKNPTKPRPSKPTQAKENGTWDVAVIGAGSAGFSAAIAAGELGARVAIFGAGTIGGTCVNVGCVPSKTLIRAMEALRLAKTAPRFGGIRAAAELEDWAAVVKMKDELVSRLRKAKYEDLLPSSDQLAYFEGPAGIAEGGVSFNGGLVRAAKVIVATGASPALPDIQGFQGISSLTSTTALELTELPKSLLVIGGGYIGCELAQVFARAGVKVTLVCRTRLLPASEPEISQALTQCFRDEGIVVGDGLAYRHIRQEEGGIVLSVDKGDSMVEFAAEKVLAATGRSANTGGLGLEEAGIELLPNGGIRVDDGMQTSRRGVYAAGDVTGGDQFVYMAAYGAKLAAENALNGDLRRYDNSAMPWVVFTDPQVAGVGLSEQAAKVKGFEVRISVLPLEYVPRALAARDTRGLIKLVAEVGADKLLGAQIMAAEGADSIQTAALAIKHSLTVKDLAETIFPYLTTVEGFKLAAQTFDKDVAKLPCCAG